MAKPPAGTAASTAQDAPRTIIPPEPAATDTAGDPPEFIREEAFDEGGSTGPSRFKAADAVERLLADEDNDPAVVALKAEIAQLKAKRDGVSPRVQALQRERDQLLMETGSDFSFNRGAPDLAALSAGPADADDPDEVKIERETTSRGLVLRIREVGAEGGSSGSHEVTLAPGTPPEAIAKAERALRLRVSNR